MNISVDHGYRMPAAVNLFKFQGRVRELANPLRDELDAAALALQATMLWDLYHFGCLPFDPTQAARQGGFMPSSTASFDYTERQNGLPRNSPAYDPYRFEMAIAADPESDRIGVIFYPGHPAYLPVIEQVATEFGLENASCSTDYDEDDEEFAADRERAEFWDRTFGQRDDLTTAMGLAFTLRGTPTFEFLTLKKYEERLGHPIVVGGHKVARRIHVSNRLIDQMAPHPALRTRMLGMSPALDDAIKAALPDVTVADLDGFHGPCEAPARTVEIERLVLEHIAANTPPRTSK